MTKDRVQVEWKQIFSSLGLLILGSLAVIGIHRGYASFVNRISISETLLMIPTGTTSLKIDSAIRIAIDGTVIAGIFGVIGLSRIGKTPRQALQMLKRRKK